MNPLKTLWKDFNQAVWLDFIQRSLVQDGGLAKLVEEDGIRGVTSNPSIFENAIAGSDEYDEAIDALLAKNANISTVDIYEALAVEDIQMAADVMRSVYDASNGTDGFVSLEVAPTLANDTQGTIDEARRLWAWVDRPNLMIKVPATPEGIPAMEELLADGININATLIFSLSHYEAVATAFLKGIKRSKKSSSVSSVASVASFFISRLDSVVDKELEAIGSEQALALCGKTAVANAQAAYARYLEIFHGKDFEELTAMGAQKQRTLWASTSTKNPNYSDVLYIEELIGKETVNTIPTNTLNDFRDHGTARASLEEGMVGAKKILTEVKALGIDLEEITNQLQDKGVTSFADAFEGLLDVLKKKKQLRLNRD